MNDEEFGRLRQVFHLPREHAAKELNISMAKLKQLCQEHGIGRWPHRIIASLNQMRASLMEQPGRSQAEQQAGLATVETELQKVMLDPNHKVDAQLLVLRRQSWKRAQRLRSRGESSTPSTPASASGAAELAPNPTIHPTAQPDASPCTRPLEMAFPFTAHYNSGMDSSLDLMASSSTDFTSPGSVTAPHPSPLPTRFALDSGSQWSSQYAESLTATLDAAACLGPSSVTMTGPLALSASPGVGGPPAPGLNGSSAALRLADQLGSTSLLLQAPGHQFTGLFDEQRNQCQTQNYHPSVSTQYMLMQGPTPHGAQVPSQMASYMPTQRQSLSQRTFTDLWPGVPACNTFLMPLLPSCPLTHNNQLNSGLQDEHNSSLERVRAVYAAMATSQDFPVNGSNELP